MKCSSAPSGAGAAGTNRRPGGQRQTNPSNRLKDSLVRRLLANESLIKDSSELFDSANESFDSQFKDSSANPLAANPWNLASRRPAGGTGKNANFGGRPDGMEASLRFRCRHHPQRGQN
jgi:hypothetical protein